MAYNQPKNNTSKIVSNFLVTHTLKCLQRKRMDKINQCLMHCGDSYAMNYRPKIIRHPKIDVLCGKSICQGIQDIVDAVGGC